MPGQANVQEQDEEYINLYEKPIHVEFPKELNYRWVVAKGDQLWLTLFNDDFGARFIEKKQNVKAIYYYFPTTNVKKIYTTLVLPTNTNAYVVIKEWWVQFNDQKRYKCWYTVKYGFNGKEWKVENATDTECKSF